MDEPYDQSCWGETIPPELLYDIFKKVIGDGNSLPAIIQLGRVCRLWYKVSLTSSLWQTVDLSICTKHKHKTELKLKWLIQHRLINCIDINLANWNISNSLCVLEHLAKASPNLKGLSLAGWKKLSSEDVKYVVDRFRELKRIDLSSISNKLIATSAVSLISLRNSIRDMNGRLTHLNLAYNCLASVPQIIDTLAIHCPNLLSLNIANISTNVTSNSRGILHIEKLQYGCPKLKVLLITNSPISLRTTSLQEQTESPGFPDLEELSVATLEDMYLMTDECIDRILKTSKNLKTLDVRGRTRLTHNSLIRLPATDLKHLYLSGCSITREGGSGLELIGLKWANSLTEVDFSWTSMQTSLDNSLRALTQKRSESQLKHINLSGTPVSLEVVKDVLKKCPIRSINLSSCRSLPRGVKRPFHGTLEVNQLKTKLASLSNQSS